MAPAQLSDQQERASINILMTTLRRDGQVESSLEPLEQASASCDTVLVVGGGSNRSSQVNLNCSQQANKTTTTTTSTSHTASGHRWPHLRRDLGGWLSAAISRWPLKSHRSSSSTSNNKCQHQNQNLNQSRTSISLEATTFSIYKLSLRKNPYKQAVCLLTAATLGIFLILIGFQLHQQIIARTQNNQPETTYQPQGNTSKDVRQSADFQPLVATTLFSALQLLLLMYVIFRFKAIESYDHLARPQRNLLISSSLLAAIAAIESKQLILLQPMSMFIIYTLLAVDNHEAFIATLAANLVHLVSVPLINVLNKIKDSDTISDYDELVYKNDNHHTGSDLNETLNNSQLLFIVIVYGFFHFVGFYLNKQSDDSCRKSFNDIKIYVKAEIMMDVEDRKLAKLMESVIPVHLAGEMRKDIMNQQQMNEGIFHRIYLHSYDNVSILFADIVNFTKISSNCTAQLLVETLNELFGRFDKAADKNHCLRIKILGDCYYCVSGIPDKAEEHAMRSVEMGLDMIDILGDLAHKEQETSSAENALNMRVGIHSGRVLCGVLGKKKWQFDVHSDDVKLANHTEQSGTPGRVHITEDTMKALRNRYQVEPAYGSRRDAYIAEKNVATYFVIPPAHRRGSLAKSVAETTGTLKKTDSTENALRDAPSIRITQTSGQPARPAEGAADVSQQQKQQQRQISDQISSKSTVGGRAVVVASQQQPAVGKFRFRQATQRLINALHFIRTIDAPFADFESPSEIAIERIMHETIVSRCRTQDVEPVTLKFKDSQLAHLYKSPSRLELLKRLLIFLSSILCLVFLALQTLPSHPSNLPQTNDHPLRLSDVGGGQQQTNSATRATYRGGLSDEQASDGMFVVNDTSGSSTMENEFAKSAAGSYYSSLQMPSASHYDQRLPLLQRSYFLIGEILLLFFITILVYMHQAEFSARRDFLWRQIAIQDKDKMALMRDCNRFIFFNLLPPHVASYFLEQGLRSHMDLYHKSYDRIGVVFATVSNFSDFYSENQGNNHGLECLRLLNEIICDFDSILDLNQFRAVDKIKTIGATYMAAIGLFPDHELPPSMGSDGESLAAEITQTSQRQPSAPDSANEGRKHLSDGTPNRNESAERDARKDVASYLQTLVKFVIEMRVRLQDINVNSYNNFTLRVGINLGPVTAGVIGASKPQYDIWGNTVNVASRMESTAEPNKIQITDEVYQILNEFNEDQRFEFTCRGRINVKGKGFMTTYYLDYVS